jgi:membrane protein implicated in regulation of membrane protease activity
LQNDPNTAFLMAFGLRMGVRVMLRERYALLRLLQGTAQDLAQGVIVALTVALLAATAAAAAGLLPWPDLALRFGPRVLPDAGMWAQIALTLIFLLLCAFLPANLRMSRLERSHRSFQMGMEDVARAYRMAHAADRTGVFALSGEFENMRARMDHLRKHPDLGALEPELLQMAAQMSYETRDLARAYSDDKVSRAKLFLQQRQEEIQTLSDRIAIARRSVDELRRWSVDVDAEERMAQVQIKRLEADLREILPTLGLDLTDKTEKNVVALPKPGK